MPTLWFRYALAAGVLMDLALEGRIDTDPEKLVVIDSSPLGDDLLDPYLARIVRSSRPRDSHYWIEDTLKFASVIQERSLQRLVERGMLRQEDSRFLWVIQTRRYPVTDDRPVREVKRADHGGAVQRRNPGCAGHRPHYPCPCMRHIRRPAVRPGVEECRRAHRADPQDGVDLPGRREGDGPSHSGNQGNGATRPDRERMMSDILWKGRPLGAALVDLDAERSQKPAELGLSGKVGRLDRGFLADRAVRTDLVAVRSPRLAF